MYPGVCTLGYAHWGMYPGVCTLGYVPWGMVSIFLFVLFVCILLDSTTRVLRKPFPENERLKRILCVNKFDHNIHMMISIYYMD